ncbi:MAG: PD-(D/E)XK nuclease family protein, partial [Vallitaleaceae bacterium]|nr:PD-(D/E)XK nuclease family protein [Vallitaleaceae bacterium]
MTQIKISVRELIEYVLRSGDINAVFLSSKRMQDGTKAHQRFQKAAGEEYLQEVSISYEVVYEDVHLLLSGRIDGLIKMEDSVTIDEIKSTARNLDDLEIGNRLHWAQVWMYAYMYAVQNDLQQVHTRLTYIELETFKIKQFVELKTLKELENFFYDVVEKYVGWAKKQNDWREISRHSMREMEFPFGAYRKGQKQLMTAVYKTIEEKKLLFSRAPTGIGKTIATLYPSIKALGHDKCDKIFYLTAKTIGKEVVVDTLEALQNKGLFIKRLVITAKDKTCLNTKKACNPEECSFAKGHFDRVNEVLEKMYDAHHVFNREIIEQYALEHRVCPYELSLDLALFCDVIICDYNYVFDPSAVLRRFFVEESGKYVVLIDEAHNLVDRAREMYSATLDKQKVMALKKKVKDIDARLYKYFNQLNKVLIDRRKVCDEREEGSYCEKEMPGDCEEALRGILFRTEKIFGTHKKWEHMEELLDFYFDS